MMDVYRASVKVGTYLGDSRADPAAALSLLSDLLSLEGVGETVKGAWAEECAVWSRSSANMMLNIC